jgi:site-specific recombinase XerD
LEQRKIEEPGKVRLSHLERYAAFLAGRYANNSVLARVLLVGRFYRWCKDQRLIAENPAKGLKAPKKTEPLLPTPPDAETIFRVVCSINDKRPVGIRNRAMLEVLFSTGLRRSELLGLELGDVRLKDRTILVRAGKGAKDRVVLLSKRAANALTHYIQSARPQLLTGLPGHNGWQEHCRKNGHPPDKALWLAAHGKAPLTKHTIAFLFKEWAKQIGQPFHPHLIRHAFAIHLLRKGADIRHVQTLLGHDSIDTSKIYLRLIKDDYKNAYDKTFPVIKLKLPRK